MDDSVGNSQPDYELFSDMEVLIKRHYIIYLGEVDSCPR